MSDRMTFWRGNRVEAEFTREIPALAREFWASEPGQSLLGPGARPPLDRVLRGWLTHPDGLNAVWTDEEAYDRLFAEVRRTWPRHVTAEVVD